MQWLFFDVGNVLLDESPWLVAYHEGAFEALRAALPDLTRAHFDRELQTGRARPDLTPVQHLFLTFIGDPSRAAELRTAYYRSAVSTYYDLSVPAEGATEVLRTCSHRYRLGIIANQLPPVRGWMARFGLDGFFEQVVYDYEVGWSKPDPRIFVEALTRAAASPSDAVMIGDRLDNDIAPAKALGMRTIHLRAMGDFARFRPNHPGEMPDSTVEALSDLPAALERIGRRVPDQKLRTRKQPNSQRSPRAGWN